MITIGHGKCVIAGDLLETAAEAALVLAAIYEKAEKQIGEDGAKRLLVGIGKAAVDREAIDSCIIRDHTYIMPE